MWWKLFFQRGWKGVQIWCVLLPNLCGWPAKDVGWVWIHMGVRLRSLNRLILTPALQTMRHSTGHTVLCPWPSVNSHQLPSLPLHATRLSEVMQEVINASPNPLHAWISSSSWIFVLFWLLQPLLLAPLNPLSGRNAEWHTHSLIIAGICSTTANFGESKSLCLHSLEMIYDPPFHDCHLWQTMLGWTSHMPQLLHDTHSLASTHIFSPGKAPQIPAPPVSKPGSKFLGIHPLLKKRIFSIYFFRNGKLNINLKIWYELVSPSVRLINTRENYFRNPQTAMLNITGGWVAWG